MTKEITQDNYESKLDELVDLRKKVSELEELTLNYRINIVKKYFPKEEGTRKFSNEKYYIDNYLSTWYIKSQKTREVVAMVISFRDLEKAEKTLKKYGVENE